MEAKAPAVTIDGMAVSNSETWIAAPVRPNTRHARIKMTGVISNRIVIPAAKGKNSDVGILRRIWKPIATSTTGTRDLPVISNIDTSQTGKETGRNIRATTRAMNGGKNTIFRKIFPNDGFSPPPYKARIKVP